MISQYELPEIIEKYLPEMQQPESRCMKPLLQVFASVNHLADFTAEAIREHHYLLAGRCFQLAERLYRQGDRIIRCLIRQSFIPSFPSFLPASPEERILIKTIIPVTLFRLYKQETGASVI